MRMTEDQRALWRQGYAAKMASIPSEHCPVARGARGGSASRLALAALGSSADGFAHDLISCPWCKGWASAELRLYQVALDSSRVPDLGPDGKVPS